MNKSTSIENLAKALSIAQGEITPALKGSDNPYFKSKYADLASVWAVARSPLSKNGLSISQVLELLEDGTTRLETILMHSSGEFLSGSYQIRPLKEDPQSYGSAITYARRYCMSAIIGIVSDVDDDGNTESGIVVSQQQVRAKPPEAAAPIVVVPPREELFDPKNAKHKKLLMEMIVEKGLPNNAENKPKFKSIYESITAMPLAQLGVYIEQYLERNKSL